MALALREFTAGFFAFLGFEVVVVLLVLPGLALWIFWALIAAGMAMESMSGPEPWWYVVLALIVLPYAFLYGAYVPAAFVNASLQAGHEPVSGAIFRWPPGRGIATSGLFAIVFAPLFLWFGAMAMSLAEAEILYRLVGRPLSLWSWSSVLLNSTLGVLVSVFAELWLSSVAASIQERLGPLRAVAAAARLAPRDVGTTMVLPVAFGVLLGLGFTAVGFWLLVVSPIAVPIACLVVVHAYRRLSARQVLRDSSARERGQMAW